MSPPALHTAVTASLLHWLLAVFPLGVGKAATVAFNTVPGKTYTIERSPDLQIWSRGTNTIVGDGNRVSLQTAMTDPKQFFRVHISSPFDFDQLTLNTNADLADLQAGFQSTNWKATATEVLRRTFTDAYWIVENDTDTNFFYFWFGDGMSDFTQMLYRLSAAVHETVHHLGFNHVTFENGHFVYALVLGADRFYSVPEMDLFPRSEILNELPVELQGSGYASTYLTGQSGTQDIVNLLDEFNAYTFSALVDKTVVNQLSGLTGMSSRDGVLTFMLYTEAYLKVARETHPRDYDKILTSVVPDLILQLWDRAEKSLLFSQGDPRLGQQDGVIRAYVYTAARLNEINLLKQRVLPRLTFTRGQ